MPNEPASTLLGVDNSDFLSGHVLADYAIKKCERFRGAAEICFDAIRSVREQSQPHRFTNGKEHNLRQEFLDPVLTALGWEFSGEGSIPGAGTPDYVLFESQGLKQGALDNIGNLGFFADASRLLEAKPWATNLTKIRASDKRTPRGQIYEYIESVHARFGIVSSGNEWMLVSRDYARAQSRHLVLDLEKMTDSTSMPDSFLLFFGLFSREGVAAQLTEELIALSHEVGERIGQDLKQNVFLAIEYLANDLVKKFPTRMSSSDGRSRTKNDCLTFLYRILFISYAEARRLFPMAPGNPYRERRSLLRIRESIRGTAPSMTQQEYIAIPTNQNRYHDNLRRLFETVNKGNPMLHMPPYNGGLFANQSGAVQEIVFSDHAVAVVVDLLSRSRSNPDRFFDYSFLGVRELGSIYEGLLEYELALAEEDLVVIRKSAKNVDLVQPASEPYKQEEVVQTIAAGSIYLTTGGEERKRIGSFYTPEGVVQNIVELVVGPPLDALLDGHQDDAPGAIQALKSFKVCDPAMGSGHFLVAAIDFIASRVLHRFESFFDDDLADDVEAVMRRYVAGHCIYGVDLNPMAVELAKVSVWLSSFESGKPLTFLDHRLQQGNSLIGGFSGDLDANTAGHATRAPYLLAENDSLVQLISRLERGVETLDDLPENSIVDVEAKYLEYQKILQSENYKRLGFAMRLVLHSLYSGNNQTAKDVNQTLKLAITSPMNTWGHQRNKERVDASQKFENSKTPFHWEIRFPDVFFRESGGFDCIIGNPPYIPTEQLQQDEKAFYKKRFENAVYRKYETSILFMSQWEQLARENGRCGFIVPVAWETGANYEKFRRTLLNFAAPRILVNLPFDVFQDANVDTCILVAEKTSSRAGQIRVGAQPTRGEVARIVPNELDAVDLEILHKETRCRFLVSSESYTLMEPYLGHRSFSLLGGITTSNQAPVLTRLQSHGHQNLEAGIVPMKEPTVSRYTLSTEDRGFIQLPRIKTFQPYAGPRVLIRRILSRQDRLECAVAMDPWICKKDYNPFRPVEEGLDVHYLLGILNSRLISRFYTALSSIAGKDDFRQTTLSELRDLLIPSWIPPTDQQWESAQELIGNVVESAEAASEIPPDTGVQRAYIALVARTITSLGAAIDKEIDRFSLNLEGVLGTDGVGSLHRRDQRTAFSQSTLAYLFGMESMQAKAFLQERLQGIRNFADVWEVYEDAIERPVQIDSGIAIVGLARALQVVQRLDESLDAAVQQLYTSCAVESNGATGIEQR